MDFRECAACSKGTKERALKTAMWVFAVYRKTTRGSSQSLCVEYKPSVFGNLHIYDNTILPVLYK